MFEELLDEQLQQARKALRAALGSSHGRYMVLLEAVLNGRVLRGDSDAALALLLAAPDLKRTPGRGPGC